MLSGIGPPGKRLGRPLTGSSPASARLYQSAPSSGWIPSPPSFQPLQFHLCLQISADWRDGGFFRQNVLPGSLAPDFGSTEEGSLAAARPSACRSLWNGLVGQLFKDRDPAQILDFFHSRHCFIFFWIFIHIGSSPTKDARSGIRISLSFFRLILTQSH